jgi:hypothetical protein
MPVLYALLAGMLVYVAILSAFGHWMPRCRWATVCGNVGLALGFAILGIGTTGIIKHGQYIIATRLGFAIFASSLAVIIGRYWLETWRARKL